MSPNKPIKEAGGTDYGSMVIREDSEARKLQAETEDNAERLAYLRKNVIEQLAGTDDKEMKAAKLLFNKSDDRLSDAADLLYDAIEEATDNADDNGVFTEADAALVTEKAAEYRKTADEVWREVRGKYAAGLQGSSQEKDIESFEQRVLSDVEAGLSQGAERLARCEKSYNDILSSGKDVVFDQDFSRRLAEYARTFEYVEGLMKALEGIKDELKEKLGKPEEIGDEEIRQMNERLDKLTASIGSLESWGKGIEKKLEQKTKEQETLAARIDDLEARLNERKSKGIFSGEKSRLLANSLLEKISKMRSGILSEMEVASIEDLAEEQILSPEKNSDIHAERMDLFFKLRPRLIKEKAEVDEMADQIISLGKIEKGMPRKMQILMETMGKKLSEVMGLNDHLSKAASSEKYATIEEIRDYANEYDALMLEVRMIYERLTPEIKAAKISELRPRLMRVDSELNRKMMTVEQRAILEGLKALIRSEDVTLEELSVISDSLEEKITKPLKEAVAKSSDEYRDKLVRQAREIAAEQEFERGAKKYEPKTSEFVPPAPSEKRKKARTEEELVEEMGMRDLMEAPAAKTWVRKGVKEMLRESGVIDLDPKDIMDRLTDEEMRMLVFNVREDALNKTDKNRDAFNQVLRAALKERIFEDLAKEQRDKMIDTVSGQAYKILKDAVAAEAESELDKIKSGEASKLAKYGKVGAKLAANIALAAGVGIGVGVGVASLIGTGGLSALAGGLSVGIVREAMKKISKSEIFKKETPAEEKKKGFFGRLADKFFKKETEEPDEEAIIREVAAKIASKEKLAVILANQIRENSSQDIIREIDNFAEQKQEAVKHPSPEASAKFEQALDGVSQEFYRKALNYVSMEYAGDNLSDDELSRMAMTLTLTIGQNQRGDVAAASAMDALQKKAKTEDKNWFLDKAEKFFKIRSEGIGAIIFGGGMAYAVAETTSAGRVVSGAIAGAGLGLMIEKRTRTGEKEKLKKTIDKLIYDTENKLRGREAGEIPPEVMDEVKKNSAYVLAQLDAGLFVDDAVLKNRAENFVARINKMAIEQMEGVGYNIDDMLSDVSARSRELEKQTKKNVDRVAKLSKSNRTLVFMGAGAVIGGALGYLGGRVSHYLRTPAPAAEHGASMETPAQAAPPEIPLRPIPPETPLRAVPPETPLQPLPPETPLSPVPPETPLKPVHEFEPRGVHKPTVEEAVGRGAKKIFEHGEAVAAKAAGGKPIEVYELYSASIKDIHNPQPVFLTREENIELQRLTQAGRGGEVFDFISRAHDRGQIYEDAAGHQYHADELDFTPDKKIVNPYDLEEPKAARATAVQEPKAPKIKNPYADDELYKKGVRPKAAGKLDTYEEVYGKKTEPARVRQLDTVEDVYGKEKPAAVPAEPSPEEQRARILKEIEERRAGEDQTDEGEIEPSDEAANIITDREHRLVAGLDSSKAKSAYAWLDKQADNRNLSGADRDAVNGLKRDFIKDAADDRKISPGLLRRITALQRRIGA